MFIFVYGVYAYFGEYINRLKEIVYGLNVQRYKETTGKLGIFLWANKTHKADVVV